GKDSTTRRPFAGGRPTRKPARHAWVRDLEALENRDLLATFSVTSLAGAGAGSLRQAIANANLSPGADTINFQVAGTIRLNQALPSITDPVAIDGTSAPGYAGAPVVTIDFRGTRGLNLARGADGSTVQALSLVRAGSAGVILDASRVTIAGNYIGLLADGSTPAGNRGDGVQINRGSRDNLIGRDDPVTGITYFNASSVAIQPVSGWQGIRPATDPGSYLITGTSGSNGLLYIGPISGSGGTSYLVNMPGAATTSVYGPDTLDNGDIRLVGSYRTGQDTVSGFLYEGSLSDLGNAGNYRSIDYPGSQFTYVHSTMGGLAVGNYDGPGQGGQPVGAGHAFIYDVASNTFVTDVVFPGSVSNTAYGIWYNGGTSYTIVGGFSQLPRSNPDGKGLPIGQAMMVDYDSATKAFTHWKAFSYPTGVTQPDIATHFEGISSVEKGVYTLNAGSSMVNGSSAEIASYVTVRRNADGSFGESAWVDLAYPGASGITTSDSVAGNQVVGIAFTDAGVISYQATVNVGFQLSNVIAGNAGNGVGVYGSPGNRIAMNYIGTDATGTRALGNRQNGIRLTSGAASIAANSATYRACHSSR
ncbi:MAG: right-handed parallel beta-helix repeat-containing protein, partial [Thermoleophilia bacterium]|nr:right-handed parallel beta-helix repeat-containing protein [Thermoleophilia bacterium]